MCQYNIVFTVQVPISIRGFGVQPNNKGQNGLPLLSTVLVNILEVCSKRNPRE